MHHRLRQFSFRPADDEADALTGTPHHLTRFAWLSVGAALATMALKSGAYLLTGSVGFLSDALESSVNLIAALVALAALTVAARPPDAEHTYGHFKAEYFSSGLEGGLILAAAAAIVFVAADRLLHPQPLQQLDVGLILSTAVALVNLAVALVLRRAARRYRSVTLEADSRHLMTDVWTSGGVLVGIAAVVLTGWQVLDPLIGIAVAAQIAFSGIHLVRAALSGLRDTSLPAPELAQVEAILAHYRARGVDFHALRTRQAGTQRFMEVHLVVPDTWSVVRGHILAEEIELAVRQVLSPISVLIHLEPQTAAEPPTGARSIP
jgi:cation diffusion facilitator family transporter